MVYVLSQEGNPLMPTKRFGKVRRMLKEGWAKVVKQKPFTIQLTYASSTYTQMVTLGIDSGYEHLGFSALSEKEELMGGEVHLLKGMVERNKERQMYRRQKRSRLRYRKPRFDNRTKEEGWFAPSIDHKFQSHLQWIGQIKKYLPVSKVIVEVASFDIQKIKDPLIAGASYQEGEQKDFWNLREYILHRDQHQCQNPNCKHKGKHLPLEVHHIGYWKEDRSDRPSNLITLCSKCHIPANHKKGKFLWGWEPALKSFRPETFMSTVRWKLVNHLGCQYTYGFETKSRRIELKLEKSHWNDAFCIAGGSNQKRVFPLTVEQVRRNNRSLEKFYDAKYIDVRTGEKASGQDLSSGRRKRNQNLNGENLRVYRGEKLSKGKRTIRKERYPIQPNDLLVYQGKKYTSKGVHNKGSRVILKETGKSVKVSDVQIYAYGKGFKIS